MQRGDLLLPRKKRLLRLRERILRLLQHCLDGGVFLFARVQRLLAQAKAHPLGMRIEQLRNDHSQRPDRHKTEHDQRDQNAFRQARPLLLTPARRAQLLSLFGRTAAANTVSHVESSSQVTEL